MVRLEMTKGDFIDLSCLVRYAWKHADSSELSMMCARYSGRMAAFLASYRSKSRKKFLVLTLTEEEFLDLGAIFQFSFRHEISSKFSLIYRYFLGCFDSLQKASVGFVDGKEII